MKMRLWAVLVSLCLLCTMFPGAVRAEEALPAETAAPAEATEAPTPTEPPVTQAPEATEIPATQAPEATEAPQTEAPATEAPAEEAPETAAPTEAPVEMPPMEPGAEAETQRLKVKFRADVRYGYANKKAIEGTLSVSGGAEPYTVTYSIDRGGKFLATLGTETVGSSASFSYMPTARGYYTVRAVVVDAEGTVSKDSFNIRVAERDHRSDKKWIRLAEEVELTGDWGRDLLNVALSQLGNCESDTDFVIKEDGVHGYTIYGAAIDGDYRAWCTAFIKWCSGYTQIDTTYFPTQHRSRDWKDRLKRLGAYEDDEDAYQPQPGDLIFFNHDGEQVPQHIGIVEKVEDGMVYTVEGNLERAVSRGVYPLDFEEIIGYGNVSLLQLKTRETSLQD